MRNCLILMLVFLLAACKQNVNQNKINITYPLEGSIFPPEISSPTLVWTDSETGNPLYEVVAKSYEGDTLLKSFTQLTQFKVDAEIWEKMKEKSKLNPLKISISKIGYSTKANVTITTSSDSVNAPIFYRAVPLPFKFARENLEKVSWHLGSISDNFKAPALLENLPVCANCHSFSKDGRTLGMDVDARDEKGAYTIARFDTKTEISDNQIINWSDFQDGTFTYGLLSQLSPDGRYAISTLKDCEIFVDLNNMEYSQLFFPFKGILAFYDTNTRKYAPLPGADDTTYVHSNPEWSPCGTSVFFCKSKAAQFDESGVLHGSLATNNTVYNKFLNDFIERKKLFKFDIYRIPFSDGKGGIAEPVLGASNNGKSNFFPKISPDGKWMVFTQAESFMLLQRDSKLYIIPANGGEPRLMKCNTHNMNSWHSWSPNSKWMVFASKKNGPYTQLFLTHIDENGNDSPPILLENFIIDGKAANIPEFVNILPNKRVEINPSFLDGKLFQLRQGQIASKKNDIELALHHFNKVLKANTLNTDALVGRADIYMKQKQFERAMADFNRAISLKPSQASYYLARGTAYGDIDEPGKAIEDFSKVIELDPYSFMAYNNRGLVKFRLRKSEEAIKDYLKSLELNDQGYMTMVNLAAALAQNKDINQAKWYFEKAIKLEPSQSLAYFGLATLMHQIGNITEGLSYLNKTLELEPNKIDALSLRAFVLEKNSDYYNALIDLKKILSINQHIDFFRKSIELCAKLNDFESMLKITMDIEGNKITYTSEVFYFRAIALKQLGKIDDACKWMNKSAALGFNDAKIKLNEFCNAK